LLCFFPVLTLICVLCWLLIFIFVLVAVATSWEMSDNH
jgi:hypothetical protein